MFCFTFVSDHNTDYIMLYSVQLKSMYSYLNCSLQTHHHHSFYFILQIFTLSIHIMFSLIPSDANDPQWLMRR